MLKILGRCLFGIIALIVIGAGILWVLLVYEETKLGPKSDKTLILGVPEKIRIERVLGKDSDAWDGSCLLIVMRVAPETIDAIKREGLEFFDESTIKPRGVGPDREFATRVYDTWRAEFSSGTHKDNYTRSAGCSEVDDKLKDLALGAAQEKTIYYTVTPAVFGKSQTLYLISVDKGLLFVTNDIF